jgi:hypothetical protein
MFARARSTPPLRELPVPSAPALIALARSLSGVALALVLATAAQADVVTTKDGRRLEGQIVSESSTEVVIDTRVGRVTVARSDVRTIERGKSAREEFGPRFERAKDDVAALLELATWAAGEKLESEARKCYRRVVVLDPKHEQAQLALGNVQYKGEWLTPKQRDARRAADEVAERKAQGLVEHEGEWVTPEVKDRLQRGLIEFEGAWMTVAEAKARQGLGELEGAWIELPLANAAAHALEVCKTAGAKGAVAARGDAVVAGPWLKPFLTEIADGLVRARALFDQQFPDAPRGFALFGGHAAEFFAWHRDSAPYVATIAPLSALTRTVGDAWRESVQSTHGWVFWDPYPISSVRAVSRPEFHVAGHCYYHYGHVLLNRYRYDGRLLPPWFGEGYASLVEWWVHGCNTVVLKADSTASQDGTVARGKEAPFGRAALTRGDWQVDLHRALTASDTRLGPFDTLARKSPGELTAVDVAMAMGIVLWLEQSGAGVLEKFHASLKASAPLAPEQELARASDRVERYDAAFKAALGLDSRAADRAWRTWFLARTPASGGGPERGDGR